jgi:hypothetical protein
VKDEMSVPTQDEQAFSARRTQLDRTVTDLVDGLGRKPADAHELRDQELLTLAAWIENGGDGSPVDPFGDPEEPAPGVKAIRDECQRRAQQGRMFAAYLSQPTVGEILRRLLDQP